jgi:AcrR family transcriptional regulator
MTSLNPPLPPLSLRAAHQQLTRHRLLDAGAALIAERGYAAVRVEEMAAAAGASRATFYLHFASKGDLALALGERIEGYDPDQQGLRTVVAEPTVASCGRWLDGYVRHLATCGPHVEACRSASSADARVQARFAERFEEAAERVGALLVDERGWSPERGRLVATVLVHQLDLLTEDWVRAGGADREADARDALARVWVTLLDEG